MPNNDDAHSYDPSLGKNALAALRETLDALPEDDVITPNSDSETGALAGLALVDVARRPEVAKRFALLPAAVFDPETVERLERAAWALWYTQVESRTASATQTDVKVDPVVVAESLVLKARLQKLLEYYLGDQPELALELADIRLGTGYSDLASDLQRYARLSDDHQEEVTGDRKLFRKGDARRARELAGLIIADLKGAMGDKASVTALRNRAWTLLSRDYAEVVATGAFLFRHEPALARLFVPLRAAIAPHRSRRPGGPPPTGPSRPSPPRERRRPGAFRPVERHCQCPERSADSLPGALPVPGTVGRQPPGARPVPGNGRSTASGSTASARNGRSTASGSTASAPDGRRPAIRGTGSALKGQG